MIINRLGGIDPLKNSQNIQQPSEKNNIPSDYDSINISDEAREMAEVYYISDVAAATPNVRADRVAEVKEKIKDPAYMSPEIIAATADALMGKFGL